MTISKPRKKAVNNRSLLYLVIGIWGVVIIGLIFVVILLTSQNSGISGDQQTLAGNPVGPSVTTEPTATPSPTVALLPTATPTITPVPLSQINLEQLAVQPGDLPAGYSAAQVRDILPAMFDGIVQPANNIYVQFAKASKVSGGVSIMLYNSVAEVDSAYAFVVGSFGETAKSVTNVGEQASIVTVPSVLILNGGGDFTFRRCLSVVHIRIGDMRDS